jgi:rRNA-processing protein FCF1
MAKSSRPEKALLDTNFLLSMARLRIRAFDEMRALGIKEFYVLEGSLEELEKLAENRGIEKEKNVVTEIMEKEGVIAIRGTGNVDDTLVEKSREFAVATNDSALRKRIKSFGGVSIYIRNRAFLEMEQ